MRSQNLRSLTRTASRLGSGLLVVASVWYLAMRIGALDWATLRASLTPQAWALTMLASVAYAGLLSLLAVAWSGQASASRRVSLTVAIVVYGRSLIAKYLPGSVIQYASRQWLGSAQGWQQRGMARASAVEIALHVAICACLAALLLCRQHALALPAAAIAIAAAALVIRLGGPGSARAALLQLAFFGGFAALVAAIAWSLGAPAGAQVMTGWFLTAWLAGFLVPLAPGGIGVREAAMLALAGHDPRNAGAALALGLTLRLVTLAGDAAFSLAAQVLSQRAAAHSVAS